jgi:hypothetical protein
MGYVVRRDMNRIVLGVGRMFTPKGGRGSRTSVSAQIHSDRRVFTFVKTKRGLSPPVA